MSPEQRAQIQRRLAEVAEERAVSEMLKHPMKALVANKPSRHGKHAPASRGKRNAYMADLMRAKRKKAKP